MQAAEATILKALMQLHAPSPVKQRAGRDKRAIRSMLQESRETLIQSIAVTAQTGLQNVTAHLAALHCITAVQESVPAPAAALSPADAPPGFAPKTPTEPSVQSPFAHKLWPFGDIAPHDSQPRAWLKRDAEPLLQLLRVHKVLASSSKQQVPQQLLAGIVQSASAAAADSPLLAVRLIQAAKDVNKEQPSPTVSASLQLLELQQLHNRGGSCSSSACEQLCNHVAARLTDPLTGASTDGSQQGSAYPIVEAVLQLAKWCQTSNGTTSDQQADMLLRFREVAHGSLEPTDTHLHVDSSDQALCLAALVKLAPTSATAWLAYADYLHTLCNNQLLETPLHSSTPASSQASAEPADVSQPDSEKSDMLDSSSPQTLIHMVNAYCTYVKLAVQSLGQAGLAEDHLPALLKLLQLLSQEELAPEVLHALKAGIESVPVLAWRCVVPQLFALLAHHDAGVWQLAQELLQALEVMDSAAVLYPALVESRRSKAGHFLCTFCFATLSADRCIVRKYAKHVLNQGLCQFCFCNKHDCTCCCCFCTTQLTGILTAHHGSFHNIYTPPSA